MRRRHKCKLRNLETRLSMEPLTGVIGIGLTGWPRADFAPIFYSGRTAYHTAVVMGKNANQPRNLAKSVTQEYDSKAMTDKASLRKQRYRRMVLVRC